MASPEQISVNHNHKAGQENPADSLMPHTEELVAAHSEAVQGIQPREANGRFAAKDSHLPADRLLAGGEKQAYQAALETAHQTLDAYDQAEPGQKVEVPEGFQLSRDWADPQHIHEQKQREHIEKIKSSLSAGMDSHKEHKTVLRGKRDVLKQERWDQRRKGLEDAARLRYGSMRLEKEPGLAEEVNKQINARVEDELGPRPLTETEQAAKQEAEQKQANQENAIKEAAYRNSVARQKADEERAKTSEAVKEFQRGYAKTGHEPKAEPESKTGEEKIGTVAGMYVEAAQAEKGSRETTAVINDIEKGIFGAVEGAGHKQLAEAIGNYYEETNEPPKDTNTAKEHLKAAMAKAGEALRQAGESEPMSAAIARIETINGKNYLVYAKTGNAKLAIEDVDSAIHELGATTSRDVCSAIELKDLDRIMLATAGLKGGLTEAFGSDDTSDSASSFAGMFTDEGAVLVIDAIDNRDKEERVVDHSTEQTKLQAAETEEPVEDEDFSPSARFKNLFYKAGASLSSAKFAATEKIRKNKRNTIIGGVIGVGALYLASKYGLDLLNGDDGTISGVLETESDRAGDEASRMPQQDGGGSDQPGNGRGEEVPQKRLETLNVQPGTGFEDSFQNQYHLTDQEASDLYWNHMQQHLQGAPGTYEISPGNIGISQPGTFNLPEGAQKELEEYLRSKGKI